MYRGRTVSVVMPAYNEEEYVSTAVRGFLDTGVADEVVVADNNSNDGTADEALKAGAKVVKEVKQGYGHACQRALREGGGDYIILTEPDGTFDPNDITKLLEKAADYDLVLGTRTNKAFIHEGANMGWLIRYGNIFIAKLMQHLYNGPELTDVGCTYRLIRKDALKKIEDKFTVGGSHFSPEMMMLAIRNGLKTVEIPVNYRPRTGTSKITGETGKALKLGLVMIKLVITNRFM